MNEIIDNEIWKNVPGFDGMVQASNLGRIKSFYSYEYGRILKQTYDNNGRGYCRIRINHHRYYPYRLVAQTFIPNPENKPEVNHKDGNKSNNRVDNLEWATRSENQKHAYKLGLQKPSEKQKQAVSKWNKENRTKKIYQCDTENNLIKIYNSCKECSQFFNTSEATISRHCTQHKLYKGYRLSYERR